MFGRTALFEPILNAPAWQKLVLAVAVLAGISGVGYFFIVAPFAAHVTALRGQRDAQQQEIVRMRAMAVELARMRREAADVERQLEIAKDKLPTEREIPALYRTLSDAAVQAGLAVSLFQPLGPRVRDFYTEIPISVVAEGGYHDVGDFVGRVAGLPRATMIGDMKLTGAGADSSRSASPARPPSAADATRLRRPLRAEITLLTYVYRPVGSPPAPKPPGTATQPDPAKR